VEPLIQALGDERHFVREPAALALGWLNDPRAVEPLIRALETDKHQFVRWRAAGALGNLGDPRAVEPLVRALESDEYNDVRGDAARSLGRLGDPRAVEPLVRALRRALGKDLEGVVWALGELRDEKAVEPLVGLLGNDDWMVRKEVAIVLGKIGGLVVEPLRRLLRDPHRVVRQAARKALKQIKKKDRKTRGS